MRRILFRGKRLDNGEWIKGGIEACSGRIFIIFQLCGFTTHQCDRYLWRSVEVDPKTVGEYVGKNNFDQDVFEGDILHLDGFWDIRIEYRNGCLCCVGADATRYNNGCTCGNINDFLNYKVIGNIYDNPELL